MDRYLFSENDPRGEVLYKQLINNPSITSDYFEDTTRENNLEDLFESSIVPLSQNSMKVKLKLLKFIRKHKLDIFSYFDTIESFFNKYYYNMELNKEAEKNIEEIFNY